MDLHAGLLEQALVCDGLYLEAQALNIELEFCIGTRLLRSPEP